MKITNQTLQVSFEHEVKVGTNNAIEATLIHQAFVYENTNGSIGMDIDFMDIENVRFLGIRIEEGYKGYQKFKEQMKELGIDVGKLLDDAAATLITDKTKMKLKSMFKTSVKSN